MNIPEMTDQCVEAIYRDWFNAPQSTSEIELIKMAVAARDAQYAAMAQEPIGYLNPKVLNADGKIDVNDSLTWSSRSVGGWTLPLYTHPAPTNPAAQERAEPVAPAVQHQSDCSTNNRGVPELLGPCDCSHQTRSAFEDFANRRYAPKGYQPERDGDGYKEDAWQLAWESWAEASREMADMRRAYELLFKENGKLRSEKVALLNASDFDAQTAPEAYLQQEIRALSATPPAPAQPKGDDVDRLLHEVFLLCEATEDAPGVEPKNEHQRGFDKGRRFEAKGIRKAIGDWFQNEFCGRTFMGEPAPDQMKPEWRNLMVSAHAKLAQPSPEPSKPEQAEAPSADLCPKSLDGAHSESWFANGDCEHCKTGAQPNAPMYYAETTLPPASAAGEREITDAQIDALLPDRAKPGFDNYECYTRNDVRKAVRAALATKPQAEQDKKGGV